MLPTLSWLYTYLFSRFNMLVHYFENYFVRLRTNHYTLLTISPILFIFDSVSNLTRNWPYYPLWRFMKIPFTWRERQNVRWKKWLARRFTKCYLYTSRFSHFANIFSRSHQFDDKCISSSGSNLSRNFYQPATRCDKQLVSECGQCSVVFQYIITYCELILSRCMNFIQYNFFPILIIINMKKIELLLPPQTLPTLVLTLAPTFVPMLQFNIHCIV